MKTLPWYKEGVRAAKGGRLPHSYRLSSIITRGEENHLILAARQL
jgi:hypothetical protein